MWVVELSHLQIIWQYGEHIARWTNEISNDDSGFPICNRDVWWKCEIKLICHSELMMILCIHWRSYVFAHSTFEISCPLWKWLKNNWSKGTLLDYFKCVYSFSYKISRACITINRNKTCIISLVLNSSLNIYIGMYVWNVYGCHTIDSYPAMANNDTIRCMLMCT